jgi:hypothetical protein
MDDVDEAQVQIPDVPVLVMVGDEDVPVCADGSCDL